MLVWVKICDMLIAHRDFIGVASRIIAWAAGGPGPPEIPVLKTQNPPPNKKFPKIPVR